MLIAYSRIFRAVVIDKFQREIEERLVQYCQEPAQLVVGTHWLEAVAVSVTQLSDTVTQQKIAASFSLNTLLGSTSFPRISELSQVLPDRVLKSTAASSWPIITLATI